MKIDYNKIPFWAEKQAKAYKETIKPRMIKETTKATALFASLALSMTLAFASAGYIGNAIEEKEDNAYNIALDAGYEEIVNEKIDEISAEYNLGNISGTEYIEKLQDSVSRDTTLAEIQLMYPESANEIKSANSNKLLGMSGILLGMIGTAVSVPSLFNQLGNKTIGAVIDYIDTKRNLKDSIKAAEEIVYDDEKEQDM